MKKINPNRLLALIVTVSASLSFLSSCGKIESRAGDQPPVSVLDSYSVNKLSTRVCASNQKLHVSDSALTLNLNNLTTTGQVKAFSFLKGTDTCALRFANYDFNTRVSSASGQINVQGLNGTGTQTVNYVVAIQNANPASCISNGSIWEVMGTGPTNTSTIQIFAKSISDDGSLNLAMTSDKLLTTSYLNQTLGLSVYTCQ